MTLTNNKLPSPPPPLRGNQKVINVHIGHQESSKIIRLLRGSLYSDKWGSCIREVVSNAYDANKEVNSLDPVTIYLPSILNSELIISDHGLGMSPHFMEHNYPKVGFSTKLHSHTQIGAFGLGRLTPLLVSDSYKIETIHNGSKGIYTMAVGEHDGLICEHLGPSFDNDCGTKIRIPCEARDIPHIMRALFQWCPFLHPPILVDDLPLEQWAQKHHRRHAHYLNLTHQLDGTDWFTTPQNSSGTSNIIALNDWVPYEVTNHQLLSLWSGMGHDIFLHFPVGHLNLTASRESLEYTPQTIQAIEAQLKQALTEITNRANQDITNCTTLKEALHKHLLFPLPIRQRLSWNGYNLHTLNLDCEDCGASKLILNKAGQLNSSKRGGRDSLLNTRNNNVFIKDIKDYKSRVYPLLKTYNSIYLIPIEALDQPIIKDMGWPLLSSLPEPAKGVSPYPPKVKAQASDIRSNAQQVKAYLWRGHQRRTAPNLLKYCDEVALDTSTLGGVCLVTRNGVIIDRDFDLNPETKRQHETELIEDLIKCLPEGTPLYLFPEANFRLLKGNWVTLGTAVKNLLGPDINLFLEAYTGRNSLPRLIRNDSWIGKIPCKQELPNIPLPHSLLNDIDPNGLMANYLLEGARILEVLNSHTQVWGAVIVSGSLPKETKLTSLAQEVKSTYPLLYCLYPPNNIMAGVTQYIRGIDLLLKQENK